MIQVDLDCRNCEPPKLNLPVFISTDGKEYPVALHLASPLHTAAYYGNDVRSLLADGARIDEVNYWGDTALDIAIIRGNEDVALQLIVGGASVWEATSPAMDQSQVVDPEHHAQPIHLAAGLWSITILDAILSKGVDVDLPDNHGHTPLHFAASNFSGISSLVWEQEFEVIGPYMEWFYSNSATIIEVIDYLVDRGADINAKDNQGTTLFLRMVNQGSGWSGGQWQVIAENLIEKGVDINTQNNSGVTPLHETVGRRNSGSDYKQEWFDKRLEPGEPLRFLLDSGARLDIKDDDGLLPLDWALRDGKYRTARLLIKKMEDAGIEIENVDELRALIDKNIESWDNPRKGILSIFN